MVHARDNLLRLMAAKGWSLCGIAAQTGLHVRTVRGILRGDRKPHAQTLHRLAEGLGVKIDEFFVDPAQLVYRRFDSRSIPVLAITIESRAELFRGWSETDFNELNTQVGTGVGWTIERVADAADAMNRRRELHVRLDWLLETGHADVVAGILTVLYESASRSGSRSENPQDRSQQT